MRLIIEASGMTLEALRDQVLGNGVSRNEWSRPPVITVPWA